MPNSARIETYLADVKSMAGDHGSAQQLAQDALRLDPDFKDAMVVIARDYYRAQKWSSRSTRSKQFWMASVKQILRATERMRKHI